MAGVLYMVATPIGNLGDISERAKEVLSSVSFIACEDTRVSGKLLAHFGLRKEMVSLHHHSSDIVLGQVVSRITKGENAAYLTDAGTPGLADPGGKLVVVAVDNGIKVIPVPGASAITAILSVAGLPTNAYMFLGYPPHKKGRQKFFTEIGGSRYPVVLFESTHRIEKTLRELGSVTNGRRLVVGRELTKMHETVYRGSAEEIVDHIKNDSSRGEFVIVVSPK